MRPDLQVLEAPHHGEVVVDKVRAILARSTAEPARFYVGVAENPTRRLAAHGVDPRLGTFWYTDLGKADRACQAARACAEHLGLRASRLVPASGSTWLYVFKMTAATKPSAAEAHRARMRTCA